jgi:hypothetical protein
MNTTAVQGEMWVVCNLGRLVSIWQPKSLMYGGRQLGSLQTERGSRHLITRMIFQRRVEERKPRSQKSPIAKSALRKGGRESGAGHC